jgi:glycosyltransferase involved in cell wall biosynthesis
MRLVIATGTFAPDASGPATYVAELAPALQARGWQVTVVTYGDGSTNYPYKLVRVSRRHPLLLRYWLYMVAVYQQATQADLVYIQGPVSEGLPGMLGAWLAGKKFALKVVGDYAWEQAQVQGGDTRTISEFQTSSRHDSHRTKLWRWIQRLVSRHARVVITPSKYLEGIVAGWGVEQARRKVILNAFHILEIKSESREVIRARLDFSTPIIVSIGRLVPWKGFAELIATMVMVRQQIPDARLVIIGDGPEYGRLQEAIQVNQLQGVVRLTGQLSFEQAFDYLRGADCLALNSSYEGLSHVLLEAMSARVPIVATDVCGNSEVIEDKSSGLLVPWNNQSALTAAIVELLQNHELSLRLVTNYPEVLKKFGSRRLVEETASALESCV